MLSTDLAPTLRLAVTTAHNLQGYLDLCWKVLDMFDLLYSCASQLQQITYDTEFAGNRGLGIDWASLGGQNLVKSASPADVGLMLQLFVCRQARPYYQKLLTGAFASQFEGHVNSCKFWNTTSPQDRCAEAGIKQIVDVRRSATFLNIFNSNTMHFHCDQ